MNYKQNEKINQVKESTLVVGIDIGSTTQYARAFDWRGIELGKVFTFSNSREGFEAFKAWMQHLQDKYRKSDVIVGIEPTGHYWFDLGAYLEDEGILLVMVNPYAVKQTKELDDNTYKFTKLYSGGIPQFVEGDVFKTVIPLNETATMKSGPKASDQVSDQVGSDAVVKKILEFCKIARTKKEISEHIGYKNLTYMTRTYIKPLLESGKLAYTIPEKPQSRLQKYITKQ